MVIQIAKPETELAELTRFVIATTRKRLEDLILKNQHRSGLYYILVCNVKRPGPNIQTVQVQEVETSGRNVMMQRFIVIPKSRYEDIARMCGMRQDLEGVPIIGAQLWAVDNRRGLARCLWILPHDSPLIRPVPEDSFSSFVFEKARALKAPVRYVRNYAGRK
jgi:hypothetical protein